MKNYRTSNANETKEIGYRIGQQLINGDIVSLVGPMGAGKTVFVQGVARALNITEAITSPTFTLINEYVGKLKLYHLDFYRLSSLEEIIWLGVEEILNGPGICLLEWGDRASAILPERTIAVKFRFSENDSRLIEINGIRRI